MDNRTISALGGRLLNLDATQHQPLYHMPNINHRIIYPTSTNHLPTSTIVSYAQHQPSYHIPNINHCIIYPTSTIVSYSQHQRLYHTLNINHRITDSTSTIVHLGRGIRFIGIKPAPFSQKVRFWVRNTELHKWRSRKKQNVLQHPAPPHRRKRQRLFAREETRKRMCVDEDYDHVGVII